MREPRYSNCLFFLSETHLIKRVDYTRLAIATKDKIFRRSAWAVYILQSSKYKKKKLLQTSVKPSFQKGRIWKVFMEHIFVNTNSKYKEDDFTNSDAVDYSQDVCICFRHEVLTCHPRYFVHPSTHPSPAVSLKHSRRSQFRLNPDSFMMVIQIPR